MALWSATNISVADQLLIVCCSIVALLIWLFQNCFYNNRLVSHLYAYSKLASELFKFGEESVTPKEDVNGIKSQHTGLAEHIEQVTGSHPLKVKIISDV